MIRNLIIALMLLLCPASIRAQKFFNLTAEEVRIDSLLPQFAYSFPLGEAYADSTYTVEISYPEFINMSSSDIERYKRITSALPPAMPEIETNIVVERKRGALELSFCPIVMRDGRYQKLVSFMLRLKATPLSRKIRRANAKAESAKSGRYAASSVLASGNWAKIRVPSTGVYQLTDAVIRQAGFSDLSKVKIYGYGGALHNEQLTESSITEYDDLKEVPTCTVNGKRLFHATGTVTWSSASTLSRTRNPYSDYGYYFITQNDAEPLTVDSAEFVSAFYPSTDDYHLLHEVDNYAWYQGGRNLYESPQISVGSSATYTLTPPAGSTHNSARMYVAITTGGGSASAQVEVNDSVVGTISVTAGGTYDHGRMGSATYTFDKPQSAYNVKITVVSGNPVCLDYISMALDTPFPEPKLTTGTFSAPQYVYNITNQNHHADKQCDMVIIVPTSAKLTAQAERIKTYHEQNDGMTVNIVPADELYNEFASGTPEADAYRLYMKMLYDRASTDAEMPKYLLLFGDCVWDNRMNTSATASLSADDYLLCFESENSFSATNCFVDDGFFCALDDGEGRNASADMSTKTDKQDVAIGRFPVSTVSDAKVMVDKTINYMNNTEAGTWQNVAMFLGDDGNENVHMIAADAAAGIVEDSVPALQVRRVLWDMYTRVSSATGNSYPEVTALIKEQMEDGALIMNYSGHGRADEMSHELVLSANDFSSFKNKGLPLWITASCDIMPFDGTATNIGECAVLNPNGGAVAFFGTTRTVYTTQNRLINDAYLSALFTKVNGKYNSIGEAQRLAKNQLITTPEGQGGDHSRNKLQYSLLGDPALRLNVPTERIVIDSINGVNIRTASTLPQMKAGSKARVVGHVESSDGSPKTDFNGIINLDVKDSKELITGKKNNTDETSTAMQYYEHQKTIFNGNDSIRSGKFDITFAVTKDINYSDEPGRISVFAIDGKTNDTAHGYSESFTVGGTDDISTDSIGPSIYCYLNSPSFSNGGNVNCTPYFVAELQDEDGLNTSGSGIGHDLQLVIDDDPMKTYTLNDNFSYDFGSYTTGSTYYNIPELEEGSHKLKFTAWDILNNPASATLRFNVVRGLTPRISSISCSDNPARTSTTFIVNHDRGGSNVDVRIEVFDISGRELWQHTESGVSATTTYTYNWDLTTDTGGRLQTGIYLYRVRLSSDGSSEVSKARKLIVVE